MQPHTLPLGDDGDEEDDDDDDSGEDDNGGEDDDGVKNVNLSIPTYVRF